MNLTRTLSIHGLVISEIVALVRALNRQAECYLVPRCVSMGFCLGRRTLREPFEYYYAAHFFECATDSAVSASM